MRAAEVAVGNGSLPGNVRRAPSISSTAANAPGAPCPTCPGGRGGPGGAYAFQDARGRGAGARAGGAGGPRLQLEREPAAFLALASRGGELGTRAAEVLERLGWPGKPGLPAPVAPLTAEEQRRFEAGREVYRNICQACHQPDGRGLERVAAPLVGSALTLAPPEVTARILLNGKEGTIGLMPPLGLTLTDSHVADVLTYVRREWGHTASPVDSAMVAAVRAQTAARTRPWTTEELLALIK
jgi:mono/diheme cytochrome c family protein